MAGSQLALVVLLVLVAVVAAAAARGMLELDKEVTMAA